MSELYLLEEISNLKAKLREKEDNLSKLRVTKQIVQANGLNNEEIARYSRQIILPDVGVEGQLKLKNASVLIVGAGGLGCPAALYLVGAGIGHLGIVDYDYVEVTNLHRQLLFSNIDQGRSKAGAAKESLKRLNHNVIITPYKLQLNSGNALDIVRQYDVILDATDNVATRYLLNDACVISGKPLVSGSALQFEGQLTVYNYAGPCYRCIFPKPPPPEAVNNCGDSGVLGAVVGTIGVLQALQAIKIILDQPGILSGRLLMFDGMDMTFRNLKLRSKNPLCVVCSDIPSVHALIDYEEFCGAKACDKSPLLKILDSTERISVHDYNELSKCSSKYYLLVDVRSNEEFKMCHLKNSINIPLLKLYNKSSIDALRKEIREAGSDIKKIFVVCRRGNDSQKAVRILRSALFDLDIEIQDLIGGIHAWSHCIDPEFPIY